MRGEAASDDDLLESFRKYADSRDPKIRDGLVEAYRWMAISSARRFANRGEPLDDLIQVASVGLFKAIERFDPERGVPFLGFAKPTILGELRRHFRDATWSVRVPRRAKDLHVSLPTAIERLSQALSRRPTPAEIAAELGVSEDDVLEAMDAGAAYRSSSLDQLIETAPPPASTEATAQRLRMEDRDQLGRLLGQLPERERRIVYLRFYEEMSQQEIADVVGTSQVHVSRLLRSSLATLHKLAMDDRSID